MASRTRSKGRTAQFNDKGRDSSSRSRLFFDAVFGGGNSSADKKQAAARRGAALRVACSQNNVAALCALLAEPGCDSNAQDATGVTPLLIAAKLGHADCCRELMSWGATAMPMSMHALPLEEAAKAGHADAVGALLAGGAPADARNHVGNTALHLACLKGHGDVVRDAKTGTLTYAHLSCFFAPSLLSFFLLILLHAVSRAPGCNLSLLFTFAIY
jgi:hypothetical protein